MRGPRVTIALVPGGRNAPVDLARWRLLGRTLGRVGDRHGSRRYALAQALVRATLVEIVLVSAQKRSQVLVVDEQHMIEQLAAYTGHPNRAAIAKGHANAIGPTASRTMARSCLARASAAFTISTPRRSKVHVACE